MSTDLFDPARRGRFNPVRHCKDPECRDVVTHLNRCDSDGHGAYHAGCCPICHPTVSRNIGGPAAGDDSGKREGAGASSS